jgi:OOP family OmpA-OmpF porin
MSLKKTLLFTILLITTLLNAEQTTTDKDKDNIPDKFDKCLNTPPGVCVTSNGCTQAIKQIVYFDINSYEIDKKNNETLKSINEISLECYGYKILLTGHADASYEEQYNLQLSKQRALAVQKQLIKNGVKKERISIKFNGEATPIATNITNQGRSKNRRVEILFY